MGLHAPKTNQELKIMVILVFGPNLKTRWLNGFSWILTQLITCELDES
jgi:hypothetical protein